MNRVKATLAMLVLGGAVVATAPVAQAQSCGLRYVEGSNRPDMNAALIANGVTCERAGVVFDDLFAGKGDHYARNGVTVDGYNCVGNPAGVYGQTGVLNYCDGGGAHFELRDP
ncbi:hypothetical protein [Mycobacterium sp.]|uniref:hypothetical protein n=1 Tax=Mycobacterium sp. TaxID=1785 RepID=UPI003F7D2F39